MPTINNARKDPAVELRALVTNKAGDIANALPKAITAERFSRIVLTAISKNPQLAECTKVSFLGAMFEAAQLGLEVNTPLGAAYLIPRKNGKTGRYECQFQIGYKGLIDLCYRTGDYTAIDAEAVHENDTFIYELGLHRDLIHKPAATNRGRVVGYYATYETKDGGKNFAYMTREEVEEHRKKYSPTKSAASPWSTNFDSMAKKTVIIRALKYARKSAEIERALSYDGTIRNVPESDSFDVSELDYMAAEYPESIEAEYTETPDETADFVPSDSIV